MRHLNDKTWPYLIVSKTDSFSEMTTWAVQEFGVDIKNQRWIFFHNGDEVQFYFKNEDDAVFFKLRWQT